MAVRILYWDGSLAALVLPYRRPTFYFTTGWVDGASAKVSTLNLFH